MFICPNFKSVIEDVPVCLKILVSLLSPQKEILGLNLIIEGLLRHCCSSILYVIFVSMTTTILISVQKFPLIFMDIIKSAMRTVYTLQDETLS